MHILNPDLSADAARIQAEIRAAIEAETRRQLAKQHEQHEAAVLEAIDTYLADLHSSMWGRAFDISTVDGRQRASAFILNTFRGVSKRMNQ
jgi:hypothetical protein